MYYAAAALEGKTPSDMYYEHMRSRYAHRKRAVRSHRELLSDLEKDCRRELRKLAAQAGEAEAEAADEKVAEKKVAWLGVVWCGVACRGLVCLLTTYYLLLYYVLLTTYYLLLTTYYLLRTTANHIPPHPIGCLSPNDRIQQETLPDGWPSLLLEQGTSGNNSEAVGASQSAQQAATSAYYLLLATYYLLPTPVAAVSPKELRATASRHLERTYYLLPTTYHLPPTTYYLLPTTYYLRATGVRFKRGTEERFEAGGGTAGGDASGGGGEGGGSPHFIFSRGFLLGRKRSHPHFKLNAIGKRPF